MVSRRAAPLVLALLAWAIPAVAPASAATGPGAAAAPRRASAPAAKAPAHKRGSLTLLYGDDHVFGIIPPDGWVVDDTSGLGSKIRVVLYPAGQKWATAQTVMYSNPLHQDARSHRTLAQMIARDLESYRKHTPKGRVIEQPAMRTRRGQIAEIRHFSATGGEPTTAVAYLEEKDMVMLLVLDSRTAAGFRSALPAFTDLVASYQFVGGGMQTPTRPKPNR